ncbi:MAG: hypothetical protein ACRCUT_00275, partial [Spirochaetota bacterium]
MGSFTEQQAEEIIKKFKRDFSIVVKFGLYTFLVILAVVVFSFILDLTIVQKKAAVPVIGIVLLLSLGVSKIGQARILSPYFNFIRRKARGESFSDDELAVFRKKYAFIPVYLATLSAVLWVIDLSIIAAGLAVVEPLSISSTVMFFTLGFGNAFISYIVYYITAKKLFKRDAAVSVYQGLTSETFHLTNSLSRELSLLFIMIIL